MFITAHLRETVTSCSPQHPEDVQCAIEILHLFDIQRDSIGQSTGPLPGLA